MLVKLKLASTVCVVVESVKGRWTLAMGFLMNEVRSFTSVPSFYHVYICVHVELVQNQPLLLITRLKALPLLLQD